MTLVRLDLIAEPLSVFGAAVGVISLIIQIADKCIKDYNSSRTKSCTNFKQASNSIIKQPIYLKYIATYVYASRSSSNAFYISVSKLVFYSRTELFTARFILIGTC